MNIFSRRLLRKTKKWVIPTVGILALVLFSGIVLFETTKTTVSVTQDGETETIKTHAKTVGDLIDDIELVVGEHDDFSHQLEDPITDDLEIYYKEANQVFVTIDGNEKTYHTTANTIEGFLNEENIAVKEHDDVSFDKKEAIVSGLNMAINQAYQVTINDAGETKQVWTTGGLIEDLLEAHDITLNEIDKVTPKLDEPLEKDGTIKITRVEKESDKVEEALAFKTETRNDDSLEKGKEKVIKEGKEGKVVKTFEVVKENGKEVERKLLDEEVKQKEQNKIVAVGTKETPKQNVVTLSNKSKSSKSSNGGNISTGAKKTKTKPASQSTKEPSGKEMTVSATAYTAKCTGCTGITATGINLNNNPNMKVIAVDPNVIPLGSKVWVEGYGTAIAGDTGGAIKGNRIDIHVPTRADAMNFGRRQVKIKILN